MTETTDRPARLVDSREDSGATLGAVTLHVVNEYEDGHHSERTVTIPGPDGEDDAERWWQDDAFNETGDGHGVDGLGSLYTVTVTASTNTAVPVGIAREF